MERFDTSILPELLEPDISFRGSLGDEKVGHEELASYVDFVRAFSLDFHNTVEQTITEGNRTFARVLYVGTHRGEVFGIQPSGRRLAYTGAAVFTFSPERIASVWVLGDIWGLVDQLQDS